MIDCKHKFIEIAESAIVRIQKHEKNFTVIDNSVINNPQMSMRTLGLLVYLLSKPNDWKPIVGDICNHFTDGRKAVLSSMRELIELGYMRRERQRNEKGRIVAISYVVFEIPPAEPDAQPDQAEAVMAAPEHSDTTATSSESIDTGQYESNHQAELELLLRCQVAPETARAASFEYTLQDIRAAVCNAREKEQRHRLTGDDSFSLPGYVLRSLSTARAEGHPVKLSKAVKKGLKSDHQKARNQAEHQRLIHRQVEQLRNEELKEPPFLSK